ncbi:MAG: MATE family efflux transporter [bacterium]|nr:MATE family efflux transporter [bacterium]
MPPLSDKSEILASDRLARLLLRLSLPAMIGMFTMALYNVVDTIYVGRGIGTLGIAGVALCFPLHVFVLAIGLLLGIGTASVISRALGAGDLPRANRAFANMLLLAVGLGLVIAVTGRSWLTLALRLFGANAEILPYARAYMSIMLLASPLFTVCIASNNVIRSEGHAGAAMLAMIIPALLNIILDPIFIFGFKLGVAGAAQATVLAQTIGAFYMAGYFASRHTRLRDWHRRLAPDRAVVGEILAIGSSAFAQQGAGSLMMIVANNNLTAYGGSLAVAVFGVINRLSMFVMMPVLGVAQGLQPIAGFNFGARRLDKTRRVVRIAAVMATAMGTAAFLILTIFPRPLIGLFTTDPHLIDGGRQALRLMILTMPVVGFQIVGATMFQAIGRPLPAMLLSLSRQCLLLIPLLLLMPRLLGLDGIWLSFPAADAVSALLTAWLMARQLRRLREAGAAECPAGAAAAAMDGQDPANRALSAEERK